MATRKRRKRQPAPPKVYPQIDDADARKYLAEELAERANQFLLFNPLSEGEDRKEFEESAKDSRDELHETINAVFMMGDANTVSMDTLTRLLDRHEAFHNGRGK
jgi:hypothetical protein